MASANWEKTSTQALRSEVQLLAWAMATGAPDGVATRSISSMRLRNGASSTIMAKAEVPAETLPVRGRTESVATMPTWVRSNRRHPSRRSRETIFEETDAGAMPSSSAALEIEPLRYTATKARNVSHDTLSVRPPMCVRLSAVVASASDYSSPTGE